MITLVLADDHDLVRVGIRRLLEEVADFKVIGEASSGEEAVTRVRELSPDVVLLDANMPGIGGLEATKRMLRYVPDVKVIVLSAYIEEPLPQKFLEVGARGYLTKGANIDEIENAVRKVKSGQIYLTPEVAQQMAIRSVQKESSPFDKLSERETQVMMMITQGVKVTEISKLLCLSPKTVNSYRYRLFEKLGVNGDVELTHLAIRYGLIKAGMQQD
ncbi:MAG: two-component system response regulator UvrY [Gammaproteobacteria bacterium]|nr:MAG: two-component system response regulator UvrY [Gammaproteobacteria bacterium]